MRLALENARAQPAEPTAPQRRGRTYSMMTMAIAPMPAPMAFITSVRVADIDRRGVHRTADRHRRVNYDRGTVVNDGRRTYRRANDDDGRRTGNRQGRQHDRRNWENRKGKAEADIHRDPGLGRRRERGGDTDDGQPQENFCFHSCTIRRRSGGGLQNRAIETGRGGIAATNEDKGEESEHGN